MKHMIQACNGIRACIVVTMMLLPTGSVGANLEAFLSGHFAAANLNFQDAENYVDAALSEDQDDTEMQRLAMQVYLAAGRFGEANELAGKLHEDDSRGPLTGIVQLTDDFINNHSRKTLEDVESFEPVPFVPARLAYAWSLLKEGRPDEALESFSIEDVADEISVIMTFNATLAHALTGNYDAALQTASSIEVYPDMLADDMAYVQAQIHAGLGNPELALETIGERPYAESDIRRIRLMNLYDRLRTGEDTGFDYVESAYGGLSQGYSLMARIYASTRSYTEAIHFLRLASALDPGNEFVSIELAELLLETDNPIFAHNALADIEEDSPLQTLASILDATALHEAGDFDSARSTLVRQLDLDQVSVTLPYALGELYRKEEMYSDAINAYGMTLQRIDENDQVDFHWPANFYRAVAYEELDLWEDAEKDFRAALEFSGNDPFMLNYLGYSLADRNMKLDEAEILIRQAVDAEPNNGMYVDSLGWVLYQMGRYEEALKQLELAVQLMSPDPVVIDHLGDAYWRTGREDAAYQQWEIALGLAEDVELIEQIRNKLEVGLDRMPEEESVVMQDN